MTKNFLITRPTHDEKVSYLYEFSKDIIIVSKERKDIHVTVLEGSNANRVNVEASLNKEKPRLVFLNGHGDKKTVLGHDNESILDSENVSLTKNKIIYALACDSLEELGPIAVENGAIAYIGYKARFMFVTDPSRSSTPSKDKNALPFKRACTALIGSLLNGLTIERSIEITKQEYIHSIRSYGTSKDNFGAAPLIRFALTWDYVFLDSEGDPNAAF